MCPSCPTALMTTRQQEEHGVVRRGVLESGSVAWGHTICLVACQGVSGLQPSHTCHESKQNSPSAQDCSASIYQVFTKPRCKPIWISQSHLTGLGHVPVVAGAFTGLQHRERTHSITFIPQLRSQVGHVLHLTELWRLATEREQQTCWNALQSLRRWGWLQISGNRGGTLAKEGDYNRHLPLWLNTRSWRCWSLTDLQFDWAPVFH